METQKGPSKDYSPSFAYYMGFHVSLGECNGLLVVTTEDPKLGVRSLRGLGAYSGGP